MDGRAIGIGCGRLSFVTLYETCNLVVLLAVLICQIAAIVDGKTTRTAPELHLLTCCRGHILRSVYLGLSKQRPRHQSWRPRWQAWTPPDLPEQEEGTEEKV